MERVTRLYKDQKGLQHLGEGCACGSGIELQGACCRALENLQATPLHSMLQPRKGPPCAFASSSNNCPLELMPGWGSGIVCMYLILRAACEIGLVSIFPSLESLDWPEDFWV